FPILKGQANVDVVGLMVSLNRQERGKTQQNALAEIREMYGIETGAIVTMEEVVEYLYNKNYNGRVLIDDAMKKAIDTYYAQYGAK
ncbi:MAG: orotate phosphoribosyltransferase, partial [Lachnospiraceae bacterium]|nr:orotate phosphoribosyltransferase [Lachnospiraceae bacterium]